MDSFIRSAYCGERSSPLRTEQINQFPTDGWRSEIADKYKKKQEDTMKKCLVTLLILCCMFALVFADAHTTRAQQPVGNGTETNPYLISNLANLRWMSENSEEWWNEDLSPAHFLQTANIDAAETQDWNGGTGFRPIGHNLGNQHLFIGVYDGGNFNISDLFIYIVADDDTDFTLGIGLFSNVEGSTLRNIHLLRNSFTMLDGQQVRTGGIAGTIRYSSIIENCSTTGHIMVTGWSLMTGGLVGWTQPNTIIRNSFTTGNINTTSNWNNSYSGGIAGSARDALIEGCYSTGNVTNESMGGGTIRVHSGGIAGEADGVSIFNCFSMGNIVTTGLATFRVYSGGIAGFFAPYNSPTISLENCYSTGTSSINGGNPNDSFAGSLIGYLLVAAVQNCFWDTETSGMTGSVGSIVSATVENFVGLTTAEMKQSSHFISAGWDFVNMWNINPEINNGYPYLRAFYESEDDGDTFNAPENLVATLHGTSVKLTWNLPVYTRVLSHFNVLRNEVEIAENITTTFFTDSTVENNTSYIYQVVAVYQNPNGVSDPSNEAELHTMFPPRNLTYGYDGNNVELQWLAPIGDGVIRYITYRDGVIQAEVSGLTWLDIDTSPETEYSYGVQAVYEAGESAIVQITLVTLGLDFNPPQLLKASVEDGFVELTWHLPAVDPDVNGLDLHNFKVFRNGVLLADNVNQTLYIDNDVTNQTEYSYYVTAVYMYFSSLAESNPSNIVDVLTMFPIRNLRATTIRHDVKLDWEAPTGGGVIGYNVFRDEELLNSAVLTALTFTDEDTIPAANYTYQVNAVYSSGESIPVEISVIIPLLSPPNLLFGNYYEGIVELNWQVPEFILNFETLLGYKVYRDGGFVAEKPSDETVFFEFDLPDGDYVYDVTAIYEVTINGVVVPGIVESDPVTVLVEVRVSDDDIIGLPLFTELVGNYPNPFNPSTTIKFALAEAGNVSIEIFNVRGQKVRTLLNEFLSPERYSIEWNGFDDNGRVVGSGVYFYLMKTVDHVETKRMVLMK